MKLSPVFLFLFLNYKTLVGASAQWPVSLPSPSSLPANFHNLSFSSERNETASSGFFLLPRSYLFLSFSHICRRGKGRRQDLLGKGGFFSCLSRPLVCAEQTVSLSLPPSLSFIFPPLKGSFPEKSSFDSVCSRIEREKDLLRRDFQRMFVRGKSFPYCWKKMYFGDSFLYFSRRRILPISGMMGARRREEEIGGEGEGGESQQLFFAP